MAGNERVVRVLELKFRAVLKLYMARFEEVDQAFAETFKFKKEKG